MAKKSKSKKLSLRQRLRTKAEEKLPAVVLEGAEAIDKIATKHGLDWRDLVKEIGEGSSKTANHNLVTQLTNKAEDDLEALYNNQIDLLPESNNANEEEA